MSLVNPSDSGFGDNNKVKHSWHIQKEADTDLCGDQCQNMREWPEAVSGGV